MSDYEARRAALLADMAALFEFFSYDVDSVLERCLEAASHIRPFDEHAFISIKPNGEFSTRLSAGLTIGSDKYELRDFYPGDASLYTVNEVTGGTANVVFPADGPIRSYVTIPLITQDDVVGLLMLGSRETNTFTEDDLDLLFSLGSHLAVAVENIRQYERAEERLNVIVSLQESYRAIAQEEELDKILARVVDEASHLVGISAMAIYLLDETGGTWGRRVSRAEDMSETPPLRVTTEELPVPVRKSLMASGHLSYIKDSDLEKLGLFRFSPRYNTVMVLPLHGEKAGKSHDTVLGFAVIEGTEIPSAQRQIIGLFASQVQILFANAVLVKGYKEKSEELDRSATMIREYTEKLQKSNETLEARVSELTILHGVSMSLPSMNDVDDTLEYILKEACSAVRAEKGILLLNENDRLVARCGRGVTNDLAISFRIGEGIAGQVAKTGKPYISENTRTDRVFKVHNESKEIPEETLLAVPLSLSGEIIGVLSVERGVTYGVFSPEEERLLVMLGAYAARVIEKAIHFEEQKNLHKQTLEAFAQAVDTKDAYTHGHSRRVSYLSTEIAKMLRLSESEVEIIQRAALLHDIGKIGISNTILFKPGALTAEEYEIMKAHVLFGENILKPIKRMAEEARLVRHHHERWDGKGYPDGLTGEEIPVGSAIIGVADAFDTMTSDRPYRRAIGRERAIEELKRCSGSQFNPLVVGALLMLHARNKLRIGGPSSAKATEGATAVAEEQIVEGERKRA